MRALWYSLIGVLLCCVLLLVVATQTRVGRTALKEVLEARFAADYFGTLEIGHVAGNLRKQVFLGDVRLKDVQGRTWLAIDSLVATPRWHALWTRRFELSRIKVLGPSLTLYGEESPFRRRAAGTGTLLQSAKIDISRGAVRVQPKTPFSPTLEAVLTAELTNLRAEAAIHWTAADRRLELSRLETLLDGTESVLEGVLIASADTVFLREIDLQLGETRLTGGGAVSDHGWEMRLNDGTLALAELGGKYFPQRRLPPVVHATASMRGTSGTVSADAVSLVWGGSHLRLKGEFTGRRDSLIYTVDVGPSRVLQEDLVYFAAVSAPRESLTAQGSVRGSYAAGTLTIRPDVYGAAMEGTYAASGHLANPDSRWEYDVNVSGTSLEIPAARAILDGNARIIGSGLSRENLDAQLAAALGPSLLGGKRWTEMAVEASFAARAGSAKVRAMGDGESVRAHVDLEWPEVWLDPRYMATVDVVQLDIGPWLGQDSLRTSVSGQLNLRGQGLSWDAMHGSVHAAVDALEVQSGTGIWIVPSHTLTAIVAPQYAAAPRILVHGDVVAATVIGIADDSAVSSLATHWGDWMREELARQTRKRRGTNNSAAVQVSSDNGRKAAAAMLGEASPPRLAVSLDLEVMRPDWLSTWLRLMPPISQRIPGVLERQGAFATSLSLEADADTLGFQGTVTDTSGLRVDLDVKAAMNAPLEETLVAKVNVHAAQFGRWGLGLKAPYASLDLFGGTGSVRIRAAQGDPVGPVVLDATVNLLEDYVRLTLDDGTIGLGDYTWHVSHGQSVDLYWNAVELNGLSLLQAGARPQVVQADGVVSWQRGRDVFFGLESLSVAQLTHFLGSGRGLDGHLDGTLHWSSASGLVGHFAVDTLRYMARVLGQLEAHSHNDSGTPDVEVSMRLRPHREGGDVQNDLSAYGGLRFRSESDPGHLDLTVDVNRLDAFLLQELIRILDTTEGAFAGSGTITGSFRRPVFDAVLEVTDTRFTIPDYHLALEMDGSVLVDSAGIHVRELVLADATGGTAAINGSVFFNEYRYLSLDIAGTLDELQIMNVPSFTRDLPWYGSVWVTGDATLTGPLDKTMLRSDNLVTSPASEVLIPIREAHGAIDPGFILYRDPTVQEAASAVRTRTSILERRPETERAFGAGIEMDLNIEGPEGSTIRLVIDPLLGDVISGMGTARIQLQRHEGEITTYGSFDITSGDYLFTAGEVFVRRFSINEGTITWTGDPLDPTLDIRADYRTRSSRSGLPDHVGGSLNTSLPLIVDLHVTGELNAVQVGLRLVLDQRHEAISDTPLLEAYLNQPDRAAQHATSVLLTNSFLLSPESAPNDLLAGSALHSVSQLATTQLNRYLSAVIPNADFTLGVLSDETADDLDVSAGIALRLLDERLLVRGHGVYLGQQVGQAGSQGLQGEFVVEIQLSPSVSIDVFFRRAGDVLSETLVTSETGVGLNYRTRFATWRDLWNGMIGADTTRSVRQ